MGTLDDVRLYLRGPHASLGGLARSTYLATEAYSTGVTGITTRGARILAVQVYEPGELKEPEMYAAEPDGRDGDITEEVRLEADLKHLAGLSHEDQVVALLDLIHEGSMRASSSRGWGAEEQLRNARARWGSVGFTSFTVTMTEKPSRNRALMARLDATLSRAGMTLAVVVQDAAGDVVITSDPLHLGVMTLATQNSFPGQLKWRTSQRVDLVPKPRRRFNPPLREITVSVPAPPVL